MEYIYIYIIGGREGKVVKRMYLNDGTLYMCNFNYESFLPLNLSK